MIKKGIHGIIIVIKNVRKVLQVDELDKKIIGDRKHLYDETVKYDETKLPQELKGLY